MEKPGMIVKWKNAWTVEGKVDAYKRNQISKLDWSKLRKEAGTKYPLPRQNYK
jgi:hypothetical protein